MRSSPRDPDRADRGGRVRLALLPARRGSRPALRVPGARAVRPGAAGTAATRPSCCSTRTARRSAGRCAGTSRCSATGSRDPPGVNTADSAPYMPKNVVINPFFDWGDDRAPRTPYHETVIYEAHVRGLTLQHPEVPGRAARQLRRAGPPGGDRAPDPARRDRRGADAGAPVRARAQPAGPRADQLLGLQHDRVPRPAHAATRRPPQLGGQVGEFKAMVKEPARGRHRGDPRRGVQPHRRSRPPRPDAVLPRHRQRRLLPAARRRPAVLPGLHRLRQQPERAAPARAAADPGLAAVLDPGDARRRVPVRPRLGAGPGAARRGPAVRVLRPGPAGPGGVPGQAHRRAVGRRRGRLPGGATSRRCGRSGTASTGTRCATSGAASRTRCRSSPPG